MHLDRRLFLQAAVATAVATFAPFRVASSAAAARAGDGEMTMSTFTPLVNTSFRFTVGNRAVSLPLQAVTDDRRPGAAGECFSLFFGAANPPFGQGSYTVSHPSLSKFGMFVVPVGRSGAVQRYQAVFNRSMP